MPAPPVPRGLVTVTDVRRRRPRGGRKKAAAGGTPRKGDARPAVSTAAACGCIWAAVAAGGAPRSRLGTLRHGRGRWAHWIVEGGGAAGKGGVSASGARGEGE
eukprot:gene17100-biopygen5101